MKASEAYEKLVQIGYDVTSGRQSKVDETKTLNQMLMSWLQLFEAYPDMPIKSIMKYNINRDFDCL